MEKERLTVGALAPLRALVLCAALTAVAATSNAAVLKPGQTEVVIAPRAASTVKWAAFEMTNFLSRVFSADIPVVTRPTGTRSAIYLGTNAWSKAAGLAPEKLPRDGFEIVADDKNVFIAGSDDTFRDAFRQMRFGRGSTFFEMGTTHGVYEFLERFCGVRMYFPGELGEIVPKAASIEVPAGRIADSPDYTTRYYSIGGWKEWMAPVPTGGRAWLVQVNNRRLRMRTETIPCCHGQYKAKFTQRFWPEHPEYFRLNADGSRAWKDTEAIPYCANSQLCQSSDIWEELYKDARSYFLGEGPEVRGMLSGKGDARRCEWGRQASERKYYDVMPHDGMKRCCCEKCKAAYIPGANFATELVWSKTARLANRLKAEGIKGFITQMAYHPYRSVPSVEIPDNVRVMVAEMGPWSIGAPAKWKADRDEIIAWTKKTHGKVWIWTYVGRYGKLNMPDLPMFTPYAYGRYYSDLAPYIFGAYAESDVQRFIYQYLPLYVFSKVCWRNSVNYKAIIEEHNRLMFGEAAAKPMSEILKTFERLYLSKVTGRFRDTELGPQAVPPTEHLLWTDVYSAEVMARLGALFDEAEKLVKPGSLEARRIAMYRDQMYEPTRARGAMYRDEMDEAKWESYYAAHPETKPLSGWSVTRGSNGNLSLSDDGTAFSFETEETLRDCRVRHALSGRDRLKPGVKYRLSWYFRLTDVMPTSRGGGYFFYAQYGRERENSVQKPSPSFMSGSTDGWVRQATEFVAAPGCKNAFVQFRIYRAKGKCEVRNVRCEELPEASAQTP